MLLTIFNLPANFRYIDVKTLLQEKCGLTEFILDNLVPHQKAKKVTVGLADEEDAAILVRKINGLYLSGQQLYVEDNRKRKESDQPYRVSGNIGQESQYQASAFKSHNNGMGEVMAPVMNNPMMMNYNMMGMPMYMPMMPVEQNVAYMGYGGSQMGVPMDSRLSAPVHNEREPVVFQGDGAAPSNRPREQGRDTFRHRDRNRNPTPERPADFNRTNRWNEQPAPIEAPMRRERSPPDQRWAPREINQAAHPPFGTRNPERPGRRNQDLYSPRQSDPEYHPIEPRREPQNTRWGSEHNPPLRPEPEQVWNAAPNQNWQPEPNRVWDEPNRRRVEPNPHWEGDSGRHERDYRPMERFEQNERHIDEGHPSDQYQNEPDFSHREHGFPDVRERESRHPEADWNDGNNRWNNKLPSNNPGKEKTFWNSRGPAPSTSRRDNPGPKPSGSNSFKANERRDERRPNPAKRNHPEREGGPANWNKIVNDYPPSKKPRDNFNKRGFEAPRQKTFAPKENPNFRPGIRAPFRPDAAVPRFTHPAALPIRPVKPQSVKSMINKDQTCRGQSTAILAKQAMAGSTIGDPHLSGRILKELKVCIKGRIDVMLGEELSCHIDDVVKRYRQTFPKKDDRSFYQLIRDKCLSQQKEQEETRETNVDAVKTDEDQSEAKEVAENDEPIDEKKEDIKDVKVPPKTPDRPQTDKQIVKERKVQHKLEFNREDYFKLDPVMDSVLDEELEKLTDIFAAECDNPIDGVDETICEAIVKSGAAEFKKVVRIHVTKRILDIHTGLAIRIFSTGKLPKKSVIKEYLRAFRIDRLTVIKNKMGTMYVANMGNFEQYDHLCRMEHDIIDGVPVTFRSMHLVGPPQKITKHQIMQRRKKFIQSQIDPIDQEDFVEDTKDVHEDRMGFYEDRKGFLKGSDDSCHEINISSVKDEDLIDF